MCAKSGAAATLPSVPGNTKAQALHRFLRCDKSAVKFFSITFVMWAPATLYRDYTRRTGSRLSEILLAAIRFSDTCPPITFVLFRPRSGPRRASAAESGSRRLPPASASPPFPVPPGFPATRRPASLHLAFEPPLQFAPPIPALIHKVCPASRFGPQRPMRPDQQAFRAPDRRPVQQNAQMRRQPHSPRMRIALPIAKQQIRHLPQFSQRGKQHRNLPKTQQPRHIRKLQRHNRLCTIHFLHPREFVTSPRIRSRGLPPASIPIGSAASAKPASPSAQTPRPALPPPQAAETCPRPPSIFRSSFCSSCARFGVTFHVCRRSSLTTLSFIPIIV